MKIYGYRVGVYFWLAVVCVVAAVVTFAVLASMHEQCYDAVRGIGCGGRR